MSPSIGGVSSVGKIKHTQSVGFSAVLLLSYYSGVFIISYIVCCRIPETALNVVGVSPQPVSK